jgi:hypothetical protein
MTWQAVSGRPWLIPRPYPLYMGLRLVSKGKSVAMAPTGVKPTPDQGRTGNMTKCVKPLRHLREI